MYIHFSVYILALVFPNFGGIVHVCRVENAAYNSSYS